jgi:hypothetical protein
MQFGNEPSAYKTSDHLNREDLNRFWKSQIQHVKRCKIQDDNKKYKSTKFGEFK